MNTRSVVISVAAVVAACAGLVAQGAQAPPAPAAQNAPMVRTASISGRVVDADTGEAVIGAVVKLQMRTLAAAAGRGAAGGRGALPLSAAEQAAANGTLFVMGDSDGRFVFHDLPKGPAQLSVTASGYVDNGGGVLRRPPMLDDGQHLGGISLTLAKVASISGVITDEAGEPLVGITVRALSRMVPMGAPTYKLTGDARTDDRGMYRIDGLFPGKYFVLVPQTPTTVPIANLEKNSDGLGGLMSAVNPFIEALTGGAQTSMGPTGVRVNDQLWQTGAGVGGAVSSAPPPPVNGRVATYQTTFYPGATQLPQAGLITVRSGEDRVGVDWQVRPTASARVAGVLSGPDGPAANISIRLVNSPGTNDDDALPVAMTTTSGDGSFAFMGVPAGSYIAKAQQTKSASAMPAGLMAGLPPEAAELMAQMNQRTAGAGGEMNLLRAPVSVTDRDVVGLSWGLRPGAHVSGRVLFEGAATPPTSQQLQNMQVSLASVMPGSPSPFGPSTSKLTTDAQFKTGSQAPGTYFVSLTGVPAAWMLKSITVGGRDVSTSGLEIGDVDLADAVIMYTDRISSLTGLVHADASPLPNATVIVIPSDYRVGIATGAIGRRQITQAVPATGTYNIARLPPGDYLVAAVVDDAMAGDRDQNFYDALARVAKPVTITAGEKKSLDLTITVKIR